jgi:hypothetical protein
LLHADRIIVLGRNPAHIHADPVNLLILVTQVCKVISGDTIYLVLTVRMTNRPFHTAANGDAAVSHRPIMLPHTRQRHG